jgi:hypothetical protein
MGATNIWCPSGHSNSAGQKFCGECGAPMPQSSPAGGAPPPIVSDARPASASETTPPPTGERPPDQTGSAVTAGVGGTKGSWGRLPTWGKVAVIVVPAVVLLMLLSGGFGHSSSWKWGYDRAGKQVDFIRSGFSPESACRGEVKAALAFGDYKPSDPQDALAGCLAGLKDMGR